jgi:hypothetical protein
MHARCPEGTVLSNDILACSLASSRLNTMHENRKAPVGPDEPSSHRAPPADLGWVFFAACVPPLILALTDPARRSAVLVGLLPALALLLLRRRTTSAGG